MFTVEKTGIMV